MFYYFVTFWPRLKFLFHKNCFRTFSEVSKTPADEGSLGKFLRKHNLHQRGFQPVSEVLN